MCELLFPYSPDGIDSTRQNFMRIYKYSMRFRVPVVDQSDCRIYYSYILKLIVLGRSIDHKPLPAFAHIELVSYPDPPTKKSRKGLDKRA